jgi:hypothetical protein
MTIGVVVEGNSTLNADLTLRRSEIKFAFSSKPRIILSQLWYCLNPTMKTSLANRESLL